MVSSSPLTDFIASRFFSTFSSSISPLHSATLHHLSTLLLPAHVQSDELAGRFRNEKYAVRMSRSGFGLLVGWLTEGVGGETLGAGEGFSGEKGKRGRATVMRVVNNHLRFDGQFSSLSFPFQIPQFPFQSRHPTPLPSLLMHGKNQQAYFRLLFPRQVEAKQTSQIHKRSIQVKDPSSWDRRLFLRNSERKQSASCVSKQ